jgi:hypothetical protein
MYQYILNHIVEYALVYLVFSAGLWTLFSSNSLVVKVIIIFGLGSVYFVWAVWHHLDDHPNFDLSVLMEYVSMLVLIMWILFSLL